MERYDPSSSINELTLDKTTFWVQVHVLPIKFMNVKAVEKICEVLGKVIPTVNPNEAEGGNFIQVRVSMDVTGPLCCGRLVSIGREKQVWISFRYERLPNICYWCGCFDHDDKDCKIWPNSEGSLSQEQRQFSPSLKAAPFSYSRKQVLIAPGFYKSRPSHAPSSMNKDSDGNKNDGEGKDKNITQAEVPSSPPLSNRELGEDMQKRNKPATMGKSQNLMQSVICTNCPTEVMPTCPQSVKRNYVPPISTHNTDLHLQEIGIALNDFDPIKNPAQNGNSSDLPFPISSPNTSAEIFTTIQRKYLRSIYSGI